MTNATRPTFEKKKRKSSRMDTIVKPTVRTSSAQPSHHHGIRYSVVEIARGTWRWAVHPPESVVGWEPTSGTVRGSRGDAMTVAKFDIERQESLAAG
jgi:hypothetical protein